MAHAQSSHRVFALLIVATLSSTACTEKAEPSPPSPVTKTAKTAKTHKALPWIHDDWAEALRRAEEAKLPIVVDLWAPWCHTCISMQKTVLTEPVVTARQAEFIWLALDTDQPKNAEALKSLPVSFWPTFYVLAPTGKVAARHVGSASAAQFVELLDEAKQALSSAGADRAMSQLAAGDAAATSGDDAAAVVAYQQALEAGGPNWSRRFAVRAELADALRRQKKHAECVEVGATSWDDMKRARAASAADFVYVVTECAKALGSEEKAKALLERAVAPGNLIEALLADEAAQLAPDDRSDALRILRELVDAAGDRDRARKLAEAQRKVLDDAVAGLDDVELVAGYAWPREEVYVYLGQGELLVPELTRSVAALPDAYDPPYRLAWLLRELGRHKEALPHAKRAAELVYGPRGIRAYWLLATIQQQLGDKAGEREAWQGVIEVIRTLPPEQRARQLPAAEKAQENLNALGPG